MKETPATMLERLMEENNMSVNEKDILLMDVLIDALECRLAYAVQREADSPDVGRTVMLVMLAKDMVQSMKNDASQLMQKQTEEREGVPLGKGMVS